MGGPLIEVHFPVPVLRVPREPLDPPHPDPVAPVPSVRSPIDSTGFSLVHRTPAFHEIFAPPVDTTLIPSPLLSRLTGASEVVFRTHFGTLPKGMIGPALVVPAPRPSRYLVEDTSPSLHPDRIGFDPNPFSITGDEIDEALVFAMSQQWYGDNAKPVDLKNATTIAMLLNGALGDLFEKRVVIPFTEDVVDEGSLARAFAGKGWVAEDPTFYEFVFSLRRWLRDEKGEKGEKAIAVLNHLLGNRDILEGLRTLFHREEDPFFLKDRILFLVQSGERVTRGTLRLFEGERIPEVEPESLIDRGQLGEHLIDVRKPEEIRRRTIGGIEGAENIPLDLPNFDARIGTLPKKDHPVFVSRDGTAALEAAHRARKSGISPVSVLKGGMIGWRRACLVAVMKKQGRWKPIAGGSYFRDPQGRVFQVWTTYDERLVVRLITGSGKGVEGVFALPTVAAVLKYFQQTEIIKPATCPLVAQVGIARAGFMALRL